MAQKATKTLASRNTARLNTTLYLTLAVHFFYWLLRALLFRSSFTRKSLVLYALLCAPQLLIQFFIFERSGRPTYGPDGQVKRSGEDLDAKGLTEYMWDVTYWTYGVLVLAAVVGDWAWWWMAVVPAYSAWLAYTTFAGVRQGYADAAGVPHPQPASKRQQKMEKRGGQKVQYR
ncbi:uncharacterized protein BDR25DRAFT_98277 [Lindgomyces ingoldianus]|uniref:Uncharacterized protein n=1 Tax=Lindgomyces ingoldianus TaxID=673940 RepID=A0ACB6QBL7_9PLEO|nr:uncharacterized protein BDR25DRAFT_98277 [Lindgomyces ingoldianus]KAF2464328.1 hypothetical protein BDR25DRAFT_98277 [Lindgomyces ingoldianus]